MCVFFLFSVNFRNITVRANSVLRGIMGESYNISSPILHPDYKKETMDNDIALLKVSKPTLAVMTFM